MTIRITGCQFDKKIKGISGFTLVEFSMVMIISGFMLVAALQAYATYVKKQRIAEIYDDLQTIKSSISNFKSASGRYPCPARPNLPISDKDAGKEDCTLIDDATYPIGTCLNSICKVGGRDADGDGTPDPVLIGAVPYATIKAGSEKAAVCNTKDTGVSVVCDADGDGVLDGDYRVMSIVSYHSNTEENSLDPWHFKVTYAVTEHNMADADPVTPNKPFKSSTGAISIETPGGLSTISPAGSAHYVLVSHGENHKGAYSKDGVLAVACSAGTFDTGNCNNDATFIDGIYSNQNNASYYDDQIAYSVYAMSSLWDFVSQGSSDIHNVNQGNVGVGTDSPSESLQVVGGMRADNAEQTLICDENGNNCWDPAFIASATGTICSGTVPASKTLVANGIRGGTLYCDPAKALNKPTGFVNKSCPAGKFLKSIKLNGDLICDVPPF